jgi:hypothetical protein
MKTVPHIVEEKYLKLFFLGTSQVKHPNRPHQRRKPQKKRQPNRPPEKRQVKQKPVKRVGIKRPPGKRLRQSAPRRQRGHIKDKLS